mmetsp:Transcript_42491/g.104661  ORF Transcript_42491/g.104661 Transcript_42491/m.104661 type:complete len:141 (-) Transcript_42491:98-520(-)
MAAERATVFLARVARAKPSTAGGSRVAGEGDCSVQGEGTAVDASVGAASLRSLGLFRVASDALISKLAQSHLGSSLEELDLRGCAKLSAGACLSALGQLKALRTLELQASSLAGQDELAKLAATLPGCDLRASRARQPNK